MPELTLQQIMNFLDDQIIFREGPDRDILIQACNLIYDHVYLEDGSLRKNGEGV
jgi:hypothetical protein